jgi:hypothetical protein
MQELLVAGFSRRDFLLVSEDCALAKPLFQDAERSLFYNTRLLTCRITVSSLEEASREGLGEAKRASAMQKAGSLLHTRSGRGPWERALLNIQYSACPRRGSS